MKLLLPLFAMSLCKVQGPTRGDAAKEFSRGWCEFHTLCGITIDEDKCARHNRHHLCEIDDTCDEPFESASLDACLFAMTQADESCQIVGFGATPHECQAFWDEWDDQ